MYMVHSFPPPKCKPQSNLVKDLLDLFIAISDLTKMNGNCFIAPHFPPHYLAATHLAEIDYLCTNQHKNIDFLPFSLMVVM